MVIGVVPLLALGYGVRERLGLRGFYELEADSALDKAGKILTGLVKRLFRFQGVLIFKCPDVVWHDVVAFILRRAQAVLIDVSQPSENLVWELETSLKTKPAEAIIIAYDHPAAAEGLEHLPDEVRLALERIQRESDLSQLRYFAYPATKPPFGLGRLKVYGSLSRKLKEELGRCLGL